VVFPPGGDGWRRRRVEIVEVSAPTGSVSEVLSTASTTSAAYRRSLRRWRKRPSRGRRSPPVCVEGGRSPAPGALVASWPPWARRRRGLGQRTRPGHHRACSSATRAPSVVPQTCRKRPGRGRRAVPSLAVSCRLLSCAIRVAMRGSVPRGVSGRRGSSASARSSNPRVAGSNPAGRVTKHPAPAGAAGAG